MIEYVFFDIGGVLGESIVGPTYAAFQVQGKIFSRARYRELIIDQRVLTGPSGTLDSLLKTEYRELGISAEELLTHFAELKPIEKSWDVARRVKEKIGHCGILSDQMAETVAALKKINAFGEIFHPLYFSPEIRMSKRTPDVFSFVSEQVNIPARSLLMIDDSNAVIGNARSAGWHGIVFENPKKLESDLKGFEVL